MQGTIFPTMKIEINIKAEKDKRTIIEMIKPVFSK
jgi:hypothetical protein